MDRWPFVRRRHTKFELAADGTIRHLVMDVRTPNGRSPRERGRQNSSFKFQGMCAFSSQKLNLEPTTKASGGVVGFSTVMIDENMVVATITEQRTTKVSYLGWRFYPARSLPIEFS